jgi:large conductance mechanosensitive channel
MGMLSEFKEFAAKGNVLDMAVGIIMGGAFGKIISTFTEGVVMPPVGKLIGGVNFSDWIINLSDKDVKSLDEAKKLGAAVMTPGVLINNIIDFLIVAFVMFMLVRSVNSFKKEEAAAPPPGPTPDQALLSEIRDLLKKK